MLIAPDSALVGFGPSPPGTPYTKRPSWRNGEILGASTTKCHALYRCLSLTSARNELIRRCFLRWQDERLLPTFRVSEDTFPGFSLNVRFPRVPTSICMTISNSPGAQNFSVSPGRPGPHTRQVNAARCISYRKQSYHFPALNKGDVIEVNEGKTHIDFAYLGNVVKRISKPLHQHTATTRKVHTGGLVKFKQ
jgi:hypothetical protein